MAKKFEHAVIYNGVFYPAGVEVPVKEPKRGGKGKDDDKKAVSENDEGTNSPAESGATE